jgi:hypothetical protein
VTRPVRLLGALLIASLLPAGPSPATVTIDDPAPQLQAAAAELTRLMARPGPERQAGLRDWLARWIDVPALAQAVLSDYVDRSLLPYERVLSKRDLRLLGERHLRRLTGPLQQRLVEDLEAALKEHKVTSVRVQGQRLQARRGQADLVLLTASGQVQARAEVARGDAGWKLVELTLGEQTLRARFEAAFASVVDRQLSPPALEAALLRRPYIVLDDFTETPPGEVPLDWGSWRDKDKDKPILYRVATEAGKPYLAAADSGQSVILGKFAHWDPREYPLMTWCWRAHALPAGGDENQDDSNDSAAGVYVIFSQNWLGVPKQLKYVWSTTVPEGTVGRRNLLFRPWFFVMESGERNLGRWVFEQVDLEAHHELKLGGQVPDRTIGLGILTDANSTHTRAEADYADLRVWTRAAQRAGQIEDYCECRNQAPGANRSGPQPQEMTR